MQPKIINAEHYTLRVLSQSLTLLVQANSQAWTWPTIKAMLLFWPSGCVAAMCRKKHSCWKFHWAKKIFCIVQLARNKRLDQFFVRDLNKDPSNWAMPDCSFDAVICCVSVQYLQQPEKVFAEIYRVLKPQGICIITFSNRLYSTKGRLLTK